MKRKIRFTKMHGAGNDYIYVDVTRYPLSDPGRLSEEWSKYHFGIGSDGLILIGKSNVADFSMRMFNNDGSEGMMCGNATRCIGKYVHDKGLTDKTNLTLETRSGIKVLDLHLKDGLVDTVTVDMGEPQYEPVDFRGRGPETMQEQPVETGGQSYVGTAISMGNPHFVIFVDDVERIDLPKVGPLLEHHPFFPNRVNVEFAQVLDGNRIRMRVWERGSGITLACGTGACATAAAACLTGRCGRECTLVMDGGTLCMKWDEATNHLL